MGIRLGASCPQKHAQDIFIFMPKATIEEQIQTRVQAFSSELSELVRAAALEAVEQVLGGQTAPLIAGTALGGRGARASARAAGAPGKRIRRTQAALESDKAALLSYVSSNPGQRLEEISAGMKIDSKHLKRPVTLLLEEKVLSKEGQRRGTRYFAGGRTKAAAKKKPARKATSKKKVKRKKAAARR